MNKTILTLLLTTSLAASANAQNCVNPSRCAELGYRDDVGKCSGRKTLLCPFDSNKAFCIDPDGGSGFYTCDDFLEAIKEVDGTIYLSRGLECDMTGKSTSIRFAEGLKVIGTADQPKIEFINVGENKPTLTLPGRNTFENLRIVNADISVSGNDKFVNIQAENISGNADITFDGANKAVRVSTCNNGNTTTVTAGSSLEATNDFNALGEINGTLNSPTINTYCNVSGKQTIFNGSIIGCRISRAVINGKYQSNCTPEHHEYITVNSPYLVKKGMWLWRYSTVNAKVYAYYDHFSFLNKVFYRTTVNTGGEVWSNFNDKGIDSSTSDIFIGESSFKKGVKIAFYSSKYPAINGIWEAKNDIENLSIKGSDVKTAAELKKYFTRIGDWDGSKPDDIN